MRGVDTCGQYVPSISNVAVHGQGPDAERDLAKGNRKIAGQVQWRDP